MTFSDFSVFKDSDFFLLTSFNYLDKLLLSPLEIIKMVSYSPITNSDKVFSVLNFIQTPIRINQLVNYYLCSEKLSDCLQDLTHQFEHPQPRSWQAIQWHEIEDKQIIGIKLEIFLDILTGTINTEIPIRGYTQTSRQYLESIHPAMARFVGGKVDTTGKLLEIGLWEKEERQHAPALKKVYQQLTGKKFISQPPKVRPYEPSSDPYQALYHHGFHRVITEYSAVCLYLWLMSHTTGELQKVFAELVQDEINHMTKFLGFGRWLFPNLYFPSFKNIIRRLIGFDKAKRVDTTQNKASLFNTFFHLMKVLNWKKWSWLNKLELIYTFVYVLASMMRWNTRLSTNYLEQILRRSPL